MVGDPDATVGTGSGAGRRAPGDNSKGAAMSPDAHVIDIHPARHLRVLMLSWEYPPVLVGGLGRHVHAL
ncbi:glycosyltransferase family 4 protein, partial [Micromonospora sp. ZYX-F-536]